MDLHHLLLAGLPAHFESSHPSQPVRSLLCDFKMCENRRSRNCGNVDRRSVAPGRQICDGRPVCRAGAAKSAKVVLGSNRRALDSCTARSTMSQPQLEDRAKWPRKPRVLRSRRRQQRSQRKQQKRRKNPRPRLIGRMSRQIRHFLPRSPNA